MKRFVISFAGALVLGTIAWIVVLLVYPLWAACLTVGDGSGKWDKFGGSPELCTWAMQVGFAIWLALVSMIFLGWYRILRK